MAPVSLGSISLLLRCLPAFPRFTDFNSIQVPTKLCACGGIEEETMKQTTSIKCALLVLGVAAILLITACGGDALEDPGTTTQTSTLGPTGAPPAPSQIATTPAASGAEVTLTPTEAAVLSAESPSPSAPVATPTAEREVEGPEPGLVISLKELNDSGQSG